MDTFTQPHSLSPPGFESNDSLLRLIANSVPAMMAYYELPALRCRFANQAYAAAYGFTPQTILNKTVAETVGEDVWLGIQPYVQRSLAGDPVKYVREQSSPDNERRVIEVSLIPHFDPPDHRRGTFVLVLDITERWRSEHSVRLSEERMRRFATATDEAIVFHREGVIIDGNEALQRLTGYTLGEMLGQLIFNFVCPACLPAVREYARVNYDAPYESCLVHKDGREIPVEVVGKTMPLENAEYRIVVVRDITARKQAQEREAFIARHDVLTQLPNRLHLNELLDAALVDASARTANGPSHVAVLFINLDHFKTVNDSLGHHVGDRLLQEVAARLKVCAGPTDIVARLGGDEFVMVLHPVQGRDEAATQAQRVLDAVRAGFTLDNVPLSMAVSIGISLYPEDGNCAETLLRSADAAMHHAKDSGRSHSQFYLAGMEGQALEDLQKERLLRQAIADNAFELHFQPQVDLAHGQLCGLEALVRWRHPSAGLVGPGQFIAFAEARGLITPIGRWVLHEACRQLKAWQDAGLPRVPVAVNLSAIEFRQRDIASEVAAVLAATGLAAQYLEIELTESVLMHHSDALQTTLHALRELGVHISVDDFGTGYSSLVYLKRYPIDKLKIDRSFVEDTPTSADDVAIVTAVIQMARSLQLRTVAEGVETPEQLALLHRLGCDLAQGYLISPPLPPEPAQAWLQTQAHGPRHGQQ